MTAWCIATILVINVPCATDGCVRCRGICNNRVGLLYLFVLLLRQASSITVVFRLVQRPPFAAPFASRCFLVCNTHTSITKSDLHRVAVRAVDFLTAQLSTFKESSPLKCLAAFPTACTACSHHHGDAATDAAIFPFISLGGAVDASHRQLNLFEGERVVSVNRELDIPAASQDRVDDCAFVCPT